MQNASPCLNVCCRSCCWSLKSVLFSTCCFNLQRQRSPNLCIAISNYSRRSVHDRSIPASLLDVVIVPVAVMTVSQSRLRAVSSTCKHNACIMAHNTRGSRQLDRANIFEHIGQGMQQVWSSSFIRVVVFGIGRLQWDRLLLSCPTSLVDPIIFSAKHKMTALVLQNATCSILPRPPSTALGHINVTITISDCSATTKRNGRHFLSDSESCALQSTSLRQRKSAYS